MNPSLDTFKNILQQARQETARVIIGQQAVIDLCLVAIFTHHHALIEGVPGVGKTLLVRTLARVLGCEFNRIQFTPDLMPSDITGTNIFNLQSNEFKLVPGPVFTTFLLADEINRAPAKTQSALLQAMQERVVTIDRETHRLSPHFTVFATQNPIEYEGTYPLPEAQKDRFMLKIQMNCFEREDEIGLVRQSLAGQSPETILARGDIKTVISEGDLDHVRQGLNEITVREELIGYLVDIMTATRRHESILVGAGPRATQSMLHAARVMAAINDRDFVTPDDIKSLAIPVLEHRLVLRPEYEIEGVSIREVIDRILQTVSVPR